ncbi:hypothetical protein CHS0354_004273 [Potamilus streckersoni]|uniref:Bestrophin homolog n=1 Tax=Potamilus streckersoni TaxID=2493646 RepID=A0AAE0S4M6_9BIVA|nr:hypothetical protein CHS0354_004273 [Potamilus streckersoni]
MTIIYQYRVANSSLCGFFKLLAIWKGSVYKLVFKEMLIFSALYTVISLTYRFALNSQQKEVFEKLAKYFNQHTSLIPVSFVLGFYVSLVVNRWWQQFLNVPWPDRTMFMTAQYLHGDDEKGKIMRRTVARYLLFGLILILRSTSVAVMKRFPTMDHIVEAGFITHDEAVLWESVECKYHKFWVPLMWVNSLLTEARKEGRIETDFGLRMIMEPLADFRDKCSICFVYDWITIPLVYTQVTTLSVYIFFLACLVGRQYTEPGKGGPGYDYDLFIPGFTMLQFFFYMGWLKVAEQLINPFGEDDDDYDMNWLLDRHFAVVMCLADQCHGKHPLLVKDAHFHEVVSNLPYTEASLSSMRQNFLGSTFNLAKPTAEEQRIVNPNDYSLDMGRSLSTGSKHAGSIWSLFSWRPHIQRLHLADSSETVTSQLSHKMSNGYLEDINVGNYVEAQSLQSEYVPLKIARTTSETEERKSKPTERSRKWSFPIYLKQKRNEVGDEENTPLHNPVACPPSPKLRFVIEPVSVDFEADNSKHKRNSHLIDMHMTGKAVSRSPALSAIEEINTVTSLKQILSPTSSRENLTEENKIETIKEEIEKDEDMVFIDADVLSTVVVDKNSV